MRRKESFSWLCCGQSPTVVVCSSLPLLSWFLRAFWPWLFSGWWALLFSDFWSPAHLGTFYELWESVTLTSLLHSPIPKSSWFPQHFLSLKYSRILFSFLRMSPPNQYNDFPVLNFLYWNTQCGFCFPDWILTDKVYDIISAFKSESQNPRLEDCTTKPSSS